MPSTNPKHYALAAARATLTTHIPMTDSEAHTRIKHYAGDLRRRAAIRRWGCIALAVAAAIIAVFVTRSWIETGGLVMVATFAALISYAIVTAVWTDPLRLSPSPVGRPLADPRAIATYDLGLDALTTQGLAELAEQTRRAEDAAAAVAAWLATPDVTLRTRDAAAVRAYLRVWDDYQAANDAMQSLKAGAFDPSGASPFNTAAR